MTENIPHPRNSTAVYRKLSRTARWAPLFILIWLLEGWPEFSGGPLLRKVLDFGHDGAFHLHRNLEQALSGLVLLLVVGHWNVCPPWRRLCRPAPKIAVVALAGFIVLAPVVASIANPAGSSSQAWWISITSLVLGALQQEIWHRVLLQSTLSRMLGSRWLGLGMAAILITIDQASGHRADVLCTAILLGVVFIRTQSLVCVTAIHIALDLSWSLLQGGPFLVSGLLKPEEFLRLRPLLCAGLLVLALVVELWFRRSPRQTQLNKAFAKNLLLIVFAMALCLLAGHVTSPFWKALVDGNEWMTRALVARVALLVEACAAVITLALVRRGPSMRDLVALHPRTTVPLAVVAALLPGLAALIAVPDEFISGLFAPLSPFTTNPYFWLGAVLPLCIGALQEEVFHRALLQPLLGRLLRSEWAGAIVGALLFAALHPPESMTVVLPGGLLLAIVFMRTRSIVCTTVLHVTFNVTLALISGTQFTLSVFIPADDFAVARPVLGVLLLVLAAGFEWHWRRSAVGRAHRLALPPNERAGTARAEPTSA